MISRPECRDFPRPGRGYRQHFLRWFLIALSAIVLTACLLVPVVHPTHSMGDQNIAHWSQWHRVEGTLADNYGKG